MRSSTALLRNRATYGVARFSRAESNSSSGNPASMRTAATCWQSFRSTSADAPRLRSAANRGPRSGGGTGGRFVRRGCVERRTPAASGARPADCRPGRAWLPVATASVAKRARRAPRDCCRAPAPRAAASAVVPPHDGPTPPGETPRRRAADRRRRDPSILAREAQAKSAPTPTAGE